MKELYSDNYVCEPQELESMKDAYNKVFRKWLQLICGTQERELMVEFSKQDADYPRISEFNISHEIS